MEFLNNNLRGRFACPFPKPSRGDRWPTGRRERTLQGRNLLRDCLLADFGNLQFPKIVVGFEERYACDAALVFGVGKIAVCGYDQEVALPDGGTWVDRFEYVALA